MRLFIKTVNNADLTIFTAIMWQGDAVKTSSKYRPCFNENTMKFVSDQT